MEEINGAGKNDSRERKEGKVLNKSKACHSRKDEKKSGVKGLFEVILT